MLWDYLAFVWFGPGHWFAFSYLVFANAYAILDFMQPEWYAKRALCTSQTLTLRVWLKLNATSIMNLIVSDVIGSLIWSIRWYLSPIVPTNDVGLGVMHIAICIVWTECWFWTSHYWMHKVSWLRRHHDKHHEYTIPFALCTLHSSPIEMLFVNLPLSILMPCILGMHPFFQTMWLVFLSFHIVTIHSSHQLLPLCVIDASYHLEHHICKSKHYGNRRIEKYIMANEPNLV